MFSSADKITIIGKSGSGKTTLSKRLHESGMWPRVVIFDRMDEYSPENASGVCYDFNQFSILIKKFYSEKRFRIIYKFNIEGNGHDDEFNEALRILYYMGGIMVVIEETWNFSSNKFLPKWYREILLTGRHGQNKLTGNGVGLITTSQRPAEVHKTVFSQSKHVFCGQLFENNDVKYVSEFIGSVNGEKCKTLRIGQFLHYEQGGETKVISNR
jgi:hypothetical protein